jgi:Flp pilus assembly protein CpaB
VLSLAPDQAQLLAVAGDKAKLTLAVRSSVDTRQLERQAEITSDALATQPAPRVFKAGPSGPQAVK